MYDFAFDFSILFVMLSSPKTIDGEIFLIKKSHINAKFTKNIQKCRICNKKKMKKNTNK